MHPRLIVLGLLAAASLSAPAWGQAVTVFSRIYAAPGREAEAQSRLEKLMAYVVQHEPGVVYRFYQARSNPQVFLTYEVFPSRDAAQKHLKEILPAAQASLGPTPEGLYGRPQEVEVVVPLNGQ